MVAVSLAKLHTTAKLTGAGNEVKQWLQGQMRGTIDKYRTKHAHCIEMSSNEDILDTDNPDAQLLLYVAHEGDTEIIEELIESGVDVDTRNKAGQTPLMLAVKDMNPWIRQTAGLLLEKGADVNAKDNNGNTPLMHTFELDSNVFADTVEFLLKAGADAKVKNNDGTATLMLDAERSGTEVTQVLIDHGADVNARNKKGDTALMIASRNTWNKDKIRFLLQAGAVINPRDRYGDGIYTFALKDIGRIVGELK